MASATEVSPDPEGAQEAAHEDGAQEVGLIRYLMWTRPIFGGILVAFGGLVTAFLPVGPVTKVGPITNILSAGIGGWAGIVCGLVELLCGFLILVAPSQRKLASIIAIIVGLLSFPMTNLGGLVVGMICSVFGGCWAFGWEPRKLKQSKDERKADRAEAKAEAEARAKAEQAEKDKSTNWLEETRKKITSWE